MAELLEEAPKGAFVISLTRNNSKIKGDRAQAIMEDAQLSFKRHVEDLGVELKKLRRDRENMLDLSPDNVTTLKVASDFDSKSFVQTDMKLGIRIRQAEIELEIAEERYAYLFVG